MNDAARAARSALAWRVGVLLALGALGLVLGLSAGAEGWSFDWAGEATLVQEIRAPRSLGAWCAGALLGLAGALAQGLFRNPLTDPYLLGAAAGAGLGVSLVLAAGSALGAGGLLLWGGDTLARLGLTGAAFAGAWAGVMLSLLLARGAARPLVLLLAGVVVGVVATALSELLSLLSPEVLRGRQQFLLGSTALVGWPQLGLLALALAVVLPLALLSSRVLDALVLGEDSARSLGLALPRWRAALVLLLALATGASVAQIGLVAFVGLMAPHLVRHWVVATHRGWLLLSTLAGALLLQRADLAARITLAPQELPVGVLTAVIGGAYLLWRLRRGAVWG